MKTITRRYGNGEVTVVWQPQLCIHARICFRGLPNVFDPRRRPWVTPEPASAATPLTDAADAADVTRIEATPNGPLLVHGSLLIRGSDGTHAKTGFTG